MGNDGGDRELYGVVVLVTQIPFPNSHGELAWKETGKRAGYNCGVDLFFQMNSPLLILVLSAVSRCDNMPVKKNE